MVIGCPGWMSKHGTATTDCEKVHTRGLHSVDTVRSQHASQTGATQLPQSTRCHIVRTLSVLSESSPSVSKRQYAADTPTLSEQCGDAEHRCGAAEEECTSVPSGS